MIGSGATAATLIPAIAEDGRARHDAAALPDVLPRPADDRTSSPTTLRALDIPEEWTHEILRRQYMSQTNWLARTSLEAPDELHAFLIEGMRPLLPEGFDVEKHFTPRYRPWQQRIAIVPDGDLFAALREGKASIVTDTIETFTEHGIKISSGEEIPADVVVTATGFNLSVFGDVAFTVDDEPVDFAERVTWRGMMISGIPNMAYMFGYFRHSWTLRVDLIRRPRGPPVRDHAGEGRHGGDPDAAPEETDMPMRPWSDPENFNAGYVMRSQHILFKQGDHEPWTHMLEHEQERESAAQGRPRRRHARLPLMPVNGTVAQGRAAFDRRAWGAACALLASATDVEDVERLAVAAHLVGRDDESDAGLGAWPIASTCGSARSTPRRGARSGWASRCCCAARSRGRAAGWRAPSGSSRRPDGARPRATCSFRCSSTPLTPATRPTAAVTRARRSSRSRSGSATRTSCAFGLLLPGPGRDRARGDSAAADALLDEVMVP